MRFNALCLENAYRDITDSKGRITINHIQALMVSITILGK